MGDAKRGKRGEGLPHNPVRAEAIGEDHLTWAVASAGWSHHCQTVAPQGESAELSTPNSLSLLLLLDTAPPSRRQETRELAGVVSGHSNQQSVGTYVNKSDLRGNLKNVCVIIFLC